MLALSVGLVPPTKSHDKMKITAGVEITLAENISNSQIMVKSFLSKVQDFIELAVFVTNRTKMAFY